jgi:AcrR family transcriptional regulator
MTARGVPQHGIPAPAAGARRTRKGSKGISTRAEIVAVATELFLKNGYGATTVDQIGEAARLTGPAIYRHFRGKSDIFAAVLFRSLDGMTLDPIARLDEAPPQQVLAEMVGVWVDAALNGRQVLALYEHEHHRLDRETLDTLRQARLRFRTPWIRVLRESRPELTEAEALAMVESIFWMISSPAFYRTELDPDQLRDRLKSMVLGALLANDGPPPVGPGRSAPRRPKRAS